MAIDWRKLAKAALLADGTIDEPEVKVLKKELYADGRIDKKEVEFLVDLNNTAKAKSPAFQKFYLKAIKDAILGNGVISDAEAKWLQQWVFADGKVADEEKKLLKDLKKSATKTSKKFDALYEACVGK